ncbi:hypothetical protein F5879DRAFT_994616 [Lentinula edodes]|nr:hypothetical protein F5879DRAFT_994616 [Lentinula edodes]
MVCVGVGVSVKACISILCIAQSQHIIVESKLDCLQPLSKQDLSKVEQVQSMAVKKFSILNDYRDHWVVYDFIRCHLKYRKQALQKIALGKAAADAQQEIQDFKRRLKVAEKNAKDKQKAKSSSDNTTAYSLLHIDAVNNALQKAERSADVDCIIYVPPLNTASGSSACCHVEVGDLRFLCPVSVLDPLLAFAFLQTFIDILREYLGTVSAATLRDNFDILYQLFEEILDSGGHPLTTSSNALRDIVVPPSLGSEDSDLLLETVLLCQAMSMASNAKLSGIPDCSLNFTNPQVLDDCALYPCVRWPFHTYGLHILLEYSSSPSTTQQSLTSVMSSRSNLAIPFMIKAIVELEDSGGLSGGGGFINTGGSQNLDTSGASSGASWSFDAQRMVLRWEIPIVSLSSSWSLHGSFSTGTRAPRPSHAIRVRFDISSHTYSK